MDEDAEHDEIDAGAHPTAQSPGTESDPIPATQSLSRDALKDEKQDPVTDQGLHGAIRTLDGNIAGDEFAADAINYQILLEKIDRLLERLNLDA
jgi:ankyrin repeat/BTB/POZ domain-containing protein 1